MFVGERGNNLLLIPKYLDLASDFRWSVYDLPHIVEAGKKVRQVEENREQLSFTTTIDELDGAEIFCRRLLAIRTGAALYDSLEVQAQTKTSAVEQTSVTNECVLYYTLQNTGTAFCPYRVVNHDQLVQSLSSFGYGLVDVWTNPDLPLIIADAAQYSLRAFSGCTSNCGNYPRLRFRKTRADRKLGETGFTL